MPDPSFDPTAIAEEIIAARAAGGRLTPFMGRVPGFGLDEGLPGGGDRPPAAAPPAPR